MSTKRTNNKYSPELKLEAVKRVLAKRNSKTKLVLCRKLTKSSSYKPIFEGKSTLEVVSILLKRDVTLCTECKKSHLKEVYSWTVP